MGRGLKRPETIAKILGQDYGSPNQGNEQGWDLEEVKLRDVQHLGVFCMWEVGTTRRKNQSIDSEESKITLVRGGVKKKEGPRLKL